MRLAGRDLPFLGVMSPRFMRCIENSLELQVDTYLKKEINTTVRCKVIYSLVDLLAEITEMANFLRRNH